MKNKLSSTHINTNHGKLQTKQIWVIHIFNLQNIE